VRAGFRIYRHSLASVPEESALDVIGHPGGSKGLFDRMAANTTANVKTASLVMGV
jgi:hypothetical protein